MIEAFLLLVSCTTYFNTNFIYHFLESNLRFVRRIQAMPQDRAPRLIETIDNLIRNRALYIYLFIYLNKECQESANNIKYTSFTNKLLNHIKLVCNI